MTTTNKDFRVKNGLIVEGNSATVNGNQVITTSDTQTLTNKTLTTPKINENVDLTATSTELNLLDGVTATTTELNYVDGVTSAIQTQIDTKAPLASPTFTGTVTIPANSAITGVPYLATANTFTTSPQQINAASSAIGLIVKANATTPGNLQQWQDSAGNVLASVNSEGFISIGTPISVFGQPPVPFSNAPISAQTSTGSQVGIAVRGVLFQTEDLQQWQNVIGTTLLRINNAGQIQAPQPASVGVVVKAAPTLTATVTNASGNGISVTYTAINTFKQGQVVTITGVNPGAYNLSSVTITDDNATSFTVQNAATGTYVSGGTATVVQTANLQEWQNSDGTARATLRPTGALNLGTLITGTQLSVTPFNNTTIGIVVRGAASQSLSLQEWQNNAGTALASIQAGGSLRISGSMGYVGGSGSQLVFQSGNNSAYFTVTSTAGSYPSLQVIGISTQTSDLQQWRGSAVILSGINSAGQIYAGTTASINGSTTTAITSAAYTSATVAVFTYGGTSLVQAGQRVTVASVTGGTYNGTWTVTAVTSTTFTVLGSGFTDVAGTGGTFTLSAVGSFVAGTAAITPIVVRGAASQTANLQEWQNSAGTSIARVDASGQLVLSGTFYPQSAIIAMGAGFYNAALSIRSFSTSTAGIVVQGRASQTGNLQEWQDSSGTILLAVDKTGNLTKGDGDQLVLAGQIYG